jgi:hypothetical protein
MSFWRHARAVLLLPAMVTVVIPAIIVWRMEWTSSSCRRCSVFC